MKRYRNKKIVRRIKLLQKCVFVFLCIGIIMFVKKNLIHANTDSVPVSNAPSDICSSINSQIPDILPTPTEFQIAFSGISQSDIPTGCESVSTTSVLQHYGIKISTDMFIRKYLPCNTLYRKKEKLYGPDPNEFFVGSPYTKGSLGCYPKVILKALNNMQIKGHPGMSELSFINTSGTEFDDLIRNYILREIPVIVWVTINMLEPYDGLQYYLEDNSLYTWTAQEHCTVLCGYDEENYYLMDPLKNGDIIAYPKTLVEKRYKEVGQNSLVIYKN